MFVLFTPDPRPGSTAVVGADVVGTDVDRESSPDAGADAGFFAALSPLHAASAPEQSAATVAAARRARLPSVSNTRDSLAAVT